jgi:regulator of protease activity HflC (stomatin/prohibitin superfamily)
MKKLLVTIACALSVTACGYAAPDAGEVGVATKKPWFFGSGGVSDTPIATGSTLVANSTHVDYIKVTPIAFDVGFDNMMPSDGIPLDFHTTIRVQVTDAVGLVRDWNGAAKNDKGDPSDAWFWSNIYPVYANMVRQDVKKFTMQQLSFEGAAIDAIDSHVTAQLTDFIAKNKIPVRLLSVTVGRAIPPQEILDQRTETAAQNQRLQTELAKQRAEEARRGAELARAQADDAYRTGMQWSPEQLIETKRIEALRQACSHGTCIIGGNNTSLMLSK